MPVRAATVPDALVLELDALQVEIAQLPFSIHVRRGGRRLVRGLGLWGADGTIGDQFIQFTEGVVPAEELEIPERVVALSVVELLPDGAEVTVRCEGGRSGHLRITLPAPEMVLVEFELEG